MHAAVDAKTLGGAIIQAVAGEDDFDYVNLTLVAGEIAAAISQANLPPQHAIEAYAYALSYSTVGGTYGEVVLSAVASDGQLAQLFDQVRNLFRLFHAAKHCCKVRIHICPERTPRADFAFNGPITHCNAYLYLFFIEV